MRLALLCFTLILGCVASAQTLRFGETLVEQVVDANRQDISAFVRLYNPSAESFEARWVREVNDLPAAWSSTVCDTNQCYVTRVDSATFRITAGGSVPITPHIYPAGVAGDGQVTIRVFQVDKRDNDAVVTFNFPRAVSNERSSYSGPRIYPNPGHQDFEVISDQPLSKVTLTNMLGKVVRTYPAYLPRYDVSDLPNGLYLVSLAGVDGRVIKTLRYSKRQVMP